MVVLHRICLRPLNTNLESKNLMKNMMILMINLNEFEFDDDEWNQAEEGWAYLPSIEWI